MNNDKMYYNYKKLEKESRKEIKEDNNNITYIYKFKIAIYCFILFIILSNKNSYKILDIIIKTFRQDSSDIINENGKPQLFGIIIMGIIFSILILILS